MSKLKDFTTQKPRPLPVFVLADVSGSMGVEGKIQALNQAIKEMLDTFKDEDDLRAEVHVSVITFGGQANIHTPLAPSKSVEWSDLSAGGGTPMGAAFALTRDTIADREIVPSRSYRPTIVLLSDGIPTDNWQEPLESLLSSERGGKAFRMALGIGADADNNVLKAFLADEESRVFQADEARQIRQFFQYVTMSVSARSRSSTPNAAPSVPVEEEWDL